MTDHQPNDAESQSVDPTGQWRWDGTQWVPNIPPTPPAPTAHRKKRRVPVWAWIVAGVVALALIGGISAAVSGGGKTKAAHSTLVPTSAPATEDVTSRQAAAEASRASSAAAKSSAEAASSAAAASASATAARAKPLTFYGSSDDVVKFPTPISDARILTATAGGDGNFVIQTLDGSGHEADLLVNTIGAYSGSVLLLPQDTISALHITANGPWTIKVHDVTTGTQWLGTNRAAGKGDTVLIVPGGTSTVETVKITNSGEGNFVVYRPTANGTCW